MPVNIAHGVGAGDRRFRFEGHDKGDCVCCKRGRFRWQADSVAFWDNRRVRHIAMWDDFPRVRSGFRVTVKGDKPFNRAN